MATIFILLPFLVLCPKHGSIKMGRYPQSVNCPSQMVFFFSSILLPFHSPCLPTILDPDQSQHWLHPLYGWTHVEWNHGLLGLICRVECRIAFLKNQGCANLLLQCKRSPTCNQTQIAETVVGRFSNCTWRPRLMGFFIWPKKLFFIFEIKSSFQKMLIFRLGKPDSVIISNAIIIRVSVFQMLTE